MKLHYFDQPKPDDDDLVLRREIDSGEIPKGCLLGGATLDVLRRTQRALENTSPFNEFACGRCLGPRDRCGGLPNTELDDASFKHEQDRLKALLLTAKDPDESGSNSTTS